MVKGGRMGMALDDSGKFLHTEEVEGMIDREQPRDGKILHAGKKGVRASAAEGRNVVLRRQHKEAMPAKGNVV